jgi:hypothetical protein
LQLLHSWFVSEPAVCCALCLVLLQHPANALVHRPMLLEYILAEKIKVRSSSSSTSSSSSSTSSRGL